MDVRSASSGPAGGWRAGDVTRRTGRTTELPADVEAVWAALTGPGWAARRAERLHDDSRLLSRTDTPAGGVEVAVSRRLPAGGPGFLRRFLPSDGRIVQTDTWEPTGGPDRGPGTRCGRWVLSAAGVPAAIGGTVRLEPAGRGCRQVVEATVRVEIPLVGGRAEAYLIDMLDILLAREGGLLTELVGDTGR